MLYLAVTNRMRFMKSLPAVLLCLLALACLEPHLIAQTIQTETFQGQEVVAGEILVRFRDGMGLPAQALTAQDADIYSAATAGRSGTMRLRSRGRNVAALLQTYRNRFDVLYAEPNYVVHAEDIPNDVLFGQQWALRNTGQTVAGFAGKPGADIKATQAWEITQGSRNIVVGVVDSGVDYTHPDLAANIWSAPAQFTVNIGGQLITCAAGTHGFNAITRTCDPMDDFGHGTHVSGILAGTGNNGAGISGVSRVGSVMGLKFMDAAGGGTVWDAIAAIDFAMQVKALFPATANVRILNNSWGGFGVSTALRDAINLTLAADMLFVASGGNSGTINDLLAHYPSNFDVPNIVAVTSTDNTDELGPSANWGPTTVHLGAPGVDITSTLPSGLYSTETGTSMSTAVVSGAAALVLSACTLTTSQLRTNLLSNVDPIPALAGKTTTGGRLNVHRSITACAGSLQPDFRLSVTPGTQTTEVNGTVNLTVTVASIGGFSSSVNLTASGMPDGVSASFNPSSVAGGSGTSTLTLTTGAAAQAGTYFITVTGTSGSRTATSSVALTVGASISLQQTISGALTTSDQVSLQDPGRYADFYRFTLNSSTTVTIDLKSRVFDPYLYVSLIPGSVLYENDDDGGDFNPRISATLPAGTYSIEVTSAFGDLGAYTLSINTPTLSSISVPVGKPGTAFNVTLEGTRFTSPLTINAGSGITVSGVSVASATRATATFTIASNASLASRDVSVSTSEGVSNALTFAIPPAIATQQRVSGSLTTADQISPNELYFYADLYRVDLATTTALTIELQSTDFTPALTLMASNGTSLLSSSSIFTGDDSNARLTTTSLAPGTYYLEVTSTSLWEVGDYTLSVNLPILNSINRRLWGANASVTVTLSGNNFGSPMTIDAGAGVTVSNIAVTNATTATALFTIAANATPGTRNVSATTPGGTTNAVSFRVYPEIPAIVPGQIVTAALATTDVLSAEFPGSYEDLYQLTVTGSTRLNITLQSAAFDAYLLVLGVTGLPATGNDNSGGNSDARITATFAAGTYFLAVTSVNRNAVGAYTLSIGQVGLTTVSPAFGSTDSTVGITLTGTRLTAPLSVDAGVGITASDVNVISGTTATATLTIAPNTAPGLRTITVTTAEGTSNPVGFNVFSSIPSIAVGQRVNGSLSIQDGSAIGNPSVYADLYRLTVASSTSMTVDLSSTAFDSYLRILSSTGALVASDDDSGGLGNARIQTTLGAGTYFVMATSFFGGVGDYSLAIGVAPTLTALTPNRAPRGTVAGVRLTGTAFITPMSVSAGTGVTVSNVEVLSPTSAIATFTIASDASAGSRSVSVTTPYGTHGAVAFDVLPPQPSQLNFPRLFAPSDLPLTGLAVSNPSGSDASITFTLYSTSGAVLGTVNETAPARGQFVKLGNQIFTSATQAGWIKATSSTVGLQSFWVGGNFTSYMDGAASAPAARELIFPLVTSQTELNIANVGSGTNTVTFRVYGSSGSELAAAVTQSIAANGIYSGGAASLFPGVDLSANVVSIRASGTGDIAGTSVTSDYPVSPSWAVVNGVDASLSLFEVNVAHVPTGPDAGWISILGVTNLSTSSQNVVITFTPVSGAPVQITRPIAGGATLRDSVHSLFGFSGAYQEGWLKVSGTAALSGFLAYGFTGTNGSAVVPGLGIPQTAMIFSHVAMGPGWGTGLALLNATSTPANVQVYIMRKDGTLVGGADNVPTAAFTLPAGTKNAKLLEELVPAANANDGFVYVRSNVPLYGLEVFFTRDVQVIANVAAGVIDASITYNPPAP